MIADPAHAQAPPPVISYTSGAVNGSATSGMFDASQSFMRRLLAHTNTQLPAVQTTALPFADTGSGALALADPLAPPPPAIPGLLAIADTKAQAAQAAATPAPRYRTWFEGYASATRTGPQDLFPGDHRSIYGGVAGVGMTLVPGVNASLSVDQGRTEIDLPIDQQNGRLDLTQIGAALNFENGPWALGVAGVAGFGNIHSSRISGTTEATASYGSRLWAASTELSYYWSSGAWRVVPKAGLDWMATRIDAFSETGGSVPVNSAVQNSNRFRTFGGAEVGYTTYPNGMMQDVSVYARVVDVLSQSVDPLVLTATGAATRTINGVFDDKVELDAGAGYSVRVAPMVKLYALYDGAWRKTYYSHTGTLGVEVRW